MDLILKVIEGPSTASWQGLEARFDASGGLIGRAETARLSLPDSSRTVSRFHAHVSCSDDTYFLEEMGSRNAASINGKALKAGSKEALRPGDKVRIGHFTLAVDFDDPDFPATQVIDRRSLQALLDDNDESTQVAVRDATVFRSGHPDAELLNAFQDGAGIQLDGSVHLRPGFMRTLGQLLRALVGGIHHVGSQRMRLRDEVSDRNAQAHARHVDPIRVAAEGTRLLAVLLKPGAIGSDKPHVRVQEMIDDLTARIAAMRMAVDAAVEQTEARLSPSSMEAAVKRSLVLDELLPMRRKARLWDLYRRTHASFNAPAGQPATDGKSEAQAGGRTGGASGVREIFNQAFTKAYEAEAARFRRSRE
ncbi:MAG TPA: type VI secretion system-associated FHA domain protein [Burkholderiaceae bacterium]|nr:type VI secretion system-associated FHA domain protein [Burkholderiaceae bacterium]